MVKSISSTSGTEPKEHLELKWCQELSVGAGLVNLGNTCYLNSVLQCLTYTPPLAIYLLSGEHSRKCKKSGFCMMCTMEQHITQVFKNSGRSIQPNTVVRHLSSIGQQFELRVQQDAHEFFLCALDAMDQSLKLNELTMESSLVKQMYEICGQSTISCGNCAAVSHALETYRDITVSTGRVSSIAEALKQHFMPEQLGGYKCSKCEKAGHSSKKLTLSKLPNVLVITLKCFEKYKGKAVRHVKYPERLDMRPFMSQPCGQPEVYQLYGVLVHSGRNFNSGHYYCHVKASNGQWYKMDDASVSISDIHSALSQQAYLLFYVRSLEKKNNDSSVGMSDAPGQSNIQIRPECTYAVNPPFIKPNTQKKTNTACSPAAKQFGGHKSRRELVEDDLEEFAPERKKKKMTDSSSVGISDAPGQSFPNDLIRPECTYEVCPPFSRTHTQNNTSPANQFSCLKRRREVVGNLEEFAPERKRLIMTVSSSVGMSDAPGQSNIQIRPECTYAVNPPFSKPNTQKKTNTACPPAAKQFGGRKRKRELVEDDLEEFAPKRKKMKMTDSSSGLIMSAGPVKQRRGCKRHFQIESYEDTYGPKRARIEPTCA